VTLRCYWTDACRDCAIEQQCTTSRQRRITRWEHDHVLEAVQLRLDETPQKMRQRRETVEHPFGTIKARMSATHFLMKTLPRAKTEMALHVLAYNLTRVINLLGAGPPTAAMRAYPPSTMPLSLKRHFRLSTGRNHIGRQELRRPHRGWRYGRRSPGAAVCR
jgi:hypothetical protein